MNRASHSTQRAILPLDRLVELVALIVGVAIDRNGERPQQRVDPKVLLKHIDRDRGRFTVGAKAAKEGRE